MEMATLSVCPACPPASTLPRPSSTRPSAPSSAPVARLAYANPFLPERVEAERDALAGSFVDAGAGPSAGVPDENTARIGRLLGPLLASARDRLVAGASAGDEDRGLYQDACLYFLRVAHEVPLQQIVDQAAPRPRPAPPSTAPSWASTTASSASPGPPSARPSPSACSPARTRIRRAIHHISTTLIGASRPAAALRAAVWQAIFTCDLRDYMAAPDGCMDDISTLVTGPTGTGKELVARALGLSGYVAVDPREGRFVAAHEPQLSAVNLAALPAALIESELFGHARGAFTGAEKEHRGWLESCGRGGVVFLDEIGEIAQEVQVKLLRVLETRISSASATRRISGSRAGSSPLPTATSPSGSPTAPSVTTSTSASAPARSAPPRCASSSTTPPASAGAWCASSPARSGPARPKR